MAEEEPVATRHPSFEGLSEQHRLCLRMVHDHMTSKDIARQLGISHHTVDQRVKTAMRILGASSRVEAAQLLARHENGHRPLVYQSPDIAAARLRTDHSPEPAQGERLGLHGYAIQEERASFDTFVPFGDPVAAPPQTGGAYNDLTASQRLALIALIAIGSALSFGAVLAGLEALSRIV